MIHNKTVIITGGNTGIGKETAINLAKRGGRIILACRDDKRGRDAEEEIRRKSGSDTVFYRQLDLASLASVRQFAELIIQDEPHIDILINNAGIMACPHWKTEDGFEMQFGVNHLGHFLLTNLLLDKLKESPSARIVNVSSLAYKRITDKESFLDYENKLGYDPWVAYGRSKLANVLFTRSLAKRLTGESVIVNCLHPGAIMTDLGRHFSKDFGYFKTILFTYTVGTLMFKSISQGAQTTIHCAVSEEVEGVSGKYFADCKQKELATEISHNDEVAEKLWTDSISMVGLDNN
jgi:retinol dehydrogenase-13